MRRLKRASSLLLVLGLVMGLISPWGQAAPASASNPSSSTLTPPPGSGTASVSWTGGPYTVVTPDPAACVHPSVNCDEFQLTLGGSATYWNNHEGAVQVEINWANSGDDFDLYVYDSTGRLVQSSAGSSGTNEKVDLGKLAPGTYKVQVVAFLVA